MARRGTTYKPTAADHGFVERAVMAGSRVADIAACLNIHADTLRKHFRYEILTARERLKGEAVRVVMDSLADGSLDAAKYVLARVAGWTEKTQVDHVSSDESMTPKNTFDASKLSTKALKELMRARGGGAT